MSFDSWNERLEYYQIVHQPSLCPHKLKEDSVGGSRCLRRVGLTPCPSWVAASSNATTKSMDSRHGTTLGVTIVIRKRRSYEGVTIDPIQRPRISQEHDIAERYEMFCGRKVVARSHNDYMLYLNAQARESDTSS